MTKNVLCLLLVMSGLLARASTSITTSSVSGHWTTAGSPYLIFNDISVDAGSSLVIDPGVSILYQGAYGLNVSGILHAAGTESQPIIFDMSDTTGWSNSSLAAGGWHGIQFLAYSGAGADSSLLGYCTLTHTKFDSAYAVTSTEPNCLSAMRSLAVTNCTFTYNQCAYGGYGLFVMTSTGQFFELGHSQFAHNSFTNQLIFIENYSGGSDHIYGNTLFSNHSGNVIFTGAAANMLLDSNEFYNNDARNGTINFVATTSLVTRDCHATIRNNKIHDNTNETDAALVCFSGQIDINANLICNNQHTSGICGFVDGGGGLNLSYNTPGPLDSTFFIVRNNIIANNYSPFHGGGISIMDAGAVIANNQIVNNYSADGGCIYIFSNFPITFKNNLMYGNVSVPDVDAGHSPCITGTATSTVGYDHNWTQHSTLFDLNLGTSFTIAGDTTTNIAGTDPLMLAPTLTASLGESALVADFGLQATSPCVNAGDTAGAYVYSTDFAGRARIVSSIIDIGAYEFSPTSLHVAGSGTGSEVRLYPNPAAGYVNVEAIGTMHTLEISDVTGHTLYRYTPNDRSMQADVSALAPAIYFIRINGVTALKFVKQ